MDKETNPHHLQRLIICKVRDSVWHKWFVIVLRGWEESDKLIWVRRNDDRDIGRFHLNHNHSKLCFKIKAFYKRLEQITSSIWDLILMQSIYLIEAINDTIIDRKLTDSRTHLWIYCISGLLFRRWWLILKEGTYRIVKLFHLV